MPGIDFHRLHTEITMRQVLELLALEPTSRSGDQLHGPCPVHGSTSSRSRSFSVNLAKGRYYCHKCRAYGNALELWAAVHKMTIYQSAIDVCTSLGVTHRGSTVGDDNRKRAREKRHRYLQIRKDDAYERIVQNQ